MIYSRLSWKIEVCIWWYLCIFGVISDVFDGQIFSGQEFYYNIVEDTGDDQADDQPDDQQWDLQKLHYANM